MGGCTFCSTAGSGDYAGNRKDTLIQQYDEGFAMMAKKWPQAKGIAYFQAYTNTYAPLSQLKKIYDPFF
ncbi:MAG: radical SAM protein, partial [Firmicutes bacterium HGW-Firmicutes-10]